jgi:hypothetical protein
MKWYNYCDSCDWPCTNCFMLRSYRMEYINQYVQYSDYKNSIYFLNDTRSKPITPNKAITIFFK